jgi:hypothetical protein
MTSFDPHFHHACERDVLIWKLNYLVQMQYNRSFDQAILFNLNQVLNHILKPTSTLNLNLQLNKFWHLISQH